MSWETLYWLSQLLLVVFAGVALVSGAVVNKRQSKQLLTLETKLEEQREKTAKAEDSLQQFKFRILLPRDITDESVNLLKKGAKGSVEILYLDNNPEAYLFAQLLQMELQGGGWTVSALSATTVDRVPDLGVKLEVGRAVYLEKETNAAGFVRLAEPGKTLFEFCQANPGMGGFRVNKDLPPDALVLVVGPKL